MESNTPKRCPSGEDGGRFILCRILYTIPGKIARVFEKFARNIFVYFIFDEIYPSLRVFGCEKLKVFALNPPENKQNLCFYTEQITKKGLQPYGNCAIIYVTVRWGGCFCRFHMVSLDVRRYWGHEKSVFCKKICISCC